MKPLVKLQCLRSAVRSCSAPPQRIRVQSSASFSSRSILPLHLVQSPSVKTALPIIGNLSYLALASGFLMIDMLPLRLALVGGYTGLTVFHVLHARPLRIPLRWSALFIAVNAGAACLIIADQMATLAEEDEELYREHFSMLSRGQFKQLLTLGQCQQLSDGTVLTVEGVPSRKLYFMKKGNARLYLRDTFAANCDEGSFINDVAFQQGEEEGAYGTTVTSGDCSVLVWSKSVLREYLKSRPEMDRNMKYCLTTHLLKALMQQREAAHLTTGQWSKDTKLGPIADARILQHRETENC